LSEVGLSPLNKLVADELSIGSMALSVKINS